MSRSTRQFKLELRQAKLEGGKRLERYPNVKDRNAIRIGHKVYHPGSIFANGRNETAVVILDIHTNVWRLVHGTGPGAYPGRGVLYKDNILWWGRENAEGKVAKEMSLSRFDLLTEEWSNCQTLGYAPCRRFQYSFDFVESRRRGIVFGGKDRLNNNLNDVHLLDVEKHRWTQPVIKGTPPSGRYGHGSCVHDGVFYCFGGHNVGGSFGHGVFLLEFESSNVGAWSVPGIPYGLPRMTSFAMIHVQGLILIFGGYSSASLFVYDTNKGIMRKPKVRIPGSFYQSASGIADGNSSGVSAVCLEKDRVVGIFGKSGNCRSYLRISMG